MILNPHVAAVADTIGVGAKGLFFVDDMPDRVSGADPRMLPGRRVHKIRVSLFEYAEPASRQDLMACGEISYHCDIHANQTVSVSYAPY
jgi:hypothetical protein